jgi:PDZ domain-containing protein
MSTDTTAPTLPPAPAQTARRRRWPWVVAVSVVVALVVSVVTASLVTVDEYRQGPGSIYRAQDLVTVTGADSFLDDLGTVDETTVSFSRATALDKALNWLHADPAVEFVDPQRFLQGRQPDENRKLNLALMDDSKQKATAVALRKLGYTVGFLGNGAVVVEVVADGPSAGVLSPGDIIVEANGMPVGTGDDLIAVVRAGQPGDVLNLQVKTIDTDPRPVTFTLGTRPNAPDQGFLGISLQTLDPRLDLPVQVDIDSGGVGGPSAGLAYTLAILDVMTPGNLTGGHRVCTTGTIDLDGSVGAIGGVRQKSAVCERGGASVFLVPVDNADEARRYAGSMRVVPVATLDEALAAIDSNGGDTAGVELAAAAPK